jgi:hypothetical protein
MSEANARRVRVELMSRRGGNLRLHWASSSYSGRRWREQMSACRPSPGASRPSSPGGEDFWRVFGNGPSPIGERLITGAPPEGSKDQLEKGSWDDRTALQ